MGENPTVRFKVIACRVFMRELSMLAARSSAVLDIAWVRQGLHNYPSLLRAAIQAEVDAAEAPADSPDAVTRPPEEYSAIILGFGLCSRAISGVTTRRLPLIVPRCHDCIAILLGSHERYQREFNAKPGTFWFSPGWIEESTFPVGDSCSLIAERFAAVYGEENGEFLAEQRREQMDAYSRSAYIRWPEVARPEHEAFVRTVAEEYGWEMEVIDGDSGLLDRIVNGQWNERETLVCRPGETVDVGVDAEYEIVVTRAVAEQADGE